MPTIRSATRPRPHRLRAARARRALPTLGAAFVAALLLPATVLAHAELATVVPADGSTVEGTPAEIVLTFTEALGANSSIQLVGPGGEQVASAGPSASDAAVMRLTPPELAPGEYTIRWTAASGDGHIERGTSSFLVVAAPTPSPTPTPTPTAAATAEPTAAPTPTEEPTPTASPAASPPPDEGGGSEGDVIVAIAGVALVVAAATVLLLRRSRR